MAAKKKKVVAKSTSSRSAAAASAKSTGKSSGAGKSAASKTKNKKVGGVEPASNRSAPSEQRHAEQESPEVKPSLEVDMTEDRMQMIETAAYFLGEKEGFRRPTREYWLEAERQIAEEFGDA